MSPVIPPPQKYSGLLRFCVVVPSCKSRSPAWSSLSSLFSFPLCKSLFLPRHVKMSNSSTQDAGNQALLLPNTARPPVHPDLLLLTGLREEELGSSFTTGRESRDGARIPGLRKNPWHTSDIMNCLAAQTSAAFAALVRRSTLSQSDLPLQASSMGSKSSRLHKRPGYTNHTSSKDLIRKLQFIKRAPIIYFNYVFFSMPG